MKIKLPVLFLSLGLSACGAIGIGANDSVTVHNASNDTISVVGRAGVSKIQPNSSSLVLGDDYMQVNSTNSECNSTAIPKKTNGAALVLDIVPGFVFGIIPLVIDAATGGLKKFPSNYTYDCQ